MVSAPQSDSARAWARPLWTWLAGIRQIVEAVNARLRYAGGLDRERPHALDGLVARPVAAVGLHNGCCWLNRHRGHEPLQIAGHRS